MTPPGCDFLNQAHPALRASPALRAVAVHALLEVALRCSVRFRLEFDRARLLTALGATSAAALLPSLPACASSEGPLARRDELLDDEKARLLRQVLSFERDMWTDLPINYIERVVLFDAQGDVVLRASDSAEFILCALSNMEHEDLIERYRAAGIPAEVVESVDVDINQGV